MNVLKASSLGAHKPKRLRFAKKKVRGFSRKKSGMIGLKKEKRGWGVSGYVRVCSSGLSGCQDTSARVSLCQMLRGMFQSHPCPHMIVWLVAFLFVIGPCPVMCLAFVLRWPPIGRPIVVSVRQWPSRQAFFVLAFPRSCRCRRGV